MIKKDNHIMMMLVIGSEAIFFISLIMGYLYFWRSGNYAAAVKASLDLRSAAVYTSMLVASSGTFWLAERSFKKDKNKLIRVWLMITILLGIVFLFGQGHEYYRLLVHDNLRLSSSLFGTTFYTLTGFHSLHVIIGVIMLMILFILSLQGFFEKPSTVLSTIGLYWHFIDIVWIAVFTIVYVVPYLT